MSMLLVEKQENTHIQTCWGQATSIRVILIHCGIDRVDTTSAARDFGQLPWP